MLSLYCWDISIYLVAKATVAVCKIISLHLSVKRFSKHLSTSQLTLSYLLLGHWHVCSIPNAEKSLPSNIKLVKIS